MGEALWIQLLWSSTGEKPYKRQISRKSFPTVTYNYALNSHRGELVWGLCETLANSIECGTVFEEEIVIYEYYTHEKSISLALEVKILLLG